MLAGSPLCRGCRQHRAVPRRRQFQHWAPVPGGRRLGQRRAAGGRPPSSRPLRWQYHLSRAARRSAGPECHGRRGPGTSVCSRLGIQRRIVRRLESRRKCALFPAMLVHAWRCHGVMPVGMLYLSLSLAAEHEAVHSIREHIPPSCSMGEYREQFYAIRVRAAQYAADPPPCIPARSPHPQSLPRLVRGGVTPVARLRVSGRYLTLLGLDRDRHCRCLSFHRGNTHRCSLVLTHGSDASKPRPRAQATFPALG